ncbi:hypothetical protein M5K25_022368 [Dendrobium thyrsiflorum]|uniref:Endonuclease/exonuclease/phosphatase domain-containing protein n=1 Tax=Dendrobium thyrsiflorum TaxID=117978 RepID=A0ABD0U670_DENTH
MWNYRGAKKKATASYVHHLLEVHNPVFFALVETKVSEFQRREVDRMFGKQWEVHCHAARGLAGGILVLGEMDQCILGSIDDGKGNCCLVATVYASTRSVERRTLWDFLQVHCANLNCPLIVGGDFNCVIGQEDKKGGKPFIFNSSAQDLWRWMISCDLKETRFSGPRFTWTNNKDGATSDHAPILLKLFVISIPIKPIIRFEDTWVSYHQTRRIIRSNWLMKAKGSAAEILNKKCLKTLRALFFWSKNKLQELSNSKVKLEANLLQLQQEECTEKGLNQDQIQEMKAIGMELQSVLARINSWWIQRAKCQWIQEGDSNSRFFQSVASLKRNCNRICSLKNSVGVTLVDKVDIASELVNFFEAKWGSKSVSLEDWPALERVVRTPDFLSLQDLISHLLYANDILIFSEATTSHLTKIREVMSRYCEWTGQRINTSKSTILFSKYTPMWKQYKLSKLLGIKRVNSFVYLGLICSINRMKASDYNRIINKALKLVHVWGLKTLSLAGRSSLIKSSLGTLINYQLAHSKVPMSVIDKIDRICRAFLWQDKQDHRGIHYVSWKKICLPKEQGGLGFKSMRMWSGPVRARLAWHFYQFPLHWHNYLLREAYGNSLDSVVHKPSRAWQILQDGWRSLKGVIRWKIGNGDSVSILKDIWLLDRRLEDWPTFYSTTIDESGRVGDLLQDGRWKEHVIRELFGPCLADLILSISVFSVSEVDKPELINSTLSCSISRQVFEAQFKHKDERFGWLKVVN